MNKSTQTLLMTLTFTASLLAGNVYAGDYSGDKVLTNKSGMTLYTFDKDSKNTSVCYGPCAAKWPPYIAADNAEAKKAWGMTTRKDGSKQWTFNGQPLYTWVGDKKAGETTGDGVGGVWHTAKKVKVKSSNYKSSGYNQSSYSPNY